MNCRLVFVALFVLSFNHALINSKLKGEKKEHGQFPDLQGKLNNDRESNNCPECTYLNYIKLFALDRADDQDEQKFKKELKKYKLPVPKPSLLKLLAKDLKEKSKDENSLPNNRLKQKDASLFLDHLAQREARPWLLKKLNNHPYLWMGAIIITVFSVGSEAGKTGSRQRRREQ